MEMQFSINKKLLRYLMEDISSNNLPISCTIGKTTKESDTYMIDVKFEFLDDDKPVFNELLERTINENML